MSDDRKPEFLSRLVGHLYDAALEPALWGEFLGELVESGTEARATLFIHSPGRPCEDVLGLKNFARDDLAEYAAHWSRLDPYVRAAASVPVGQVNYHHATVSDAVLEESAYYHDFLRPRRIGYRGVNLVVERSARRTVRLALTNGDPGLKRLARPHRVMTLVAPHLARAVRLHGVMAGARTDRDAAYGALDRLALPLALLGLDGRVVFFNEACDALLRQSDGLSLGRDSRLNAADAAVTAKLRLAIDGVATAESAGEEDGWLPLPRPSGRPALQALVSPLSRQASEAGIGGVVGAWAMVIVTDPEQRPRAPLAWLATRFGLTPAELRLAELLIEGGRLEDAAAALHITVFTARSRLKQIFAKTGSTRQADFIRLALSAPHRHFR